MEDFEKIHPLLGGQLFTKVMDDWVLKWESNQNFRHWCYLSYPTHTKNILLVLFNPGNLNREGKKLSSDITLRIIREVFSNSGINPFIINLFDHADVGGKKIYDVWNDRDSNSLIYNKLLKYNFSRIIFAYGKIDSRDIHYNEINNRINLIRKTFSHITEYILDEEYKHPRRWELEKNKKEISVKLLHLYKNILS